MKIRTVSKKEVLEAISEGSKDYYYVISKQVRDYSRYEGENRFLTMHSMKTVYNMKLKNLMNFDDDALFVLIEE